MTAPAPSREPSAHYEQLRALLEQHGVDMRYLANHEMLKALDAFAAAAIERERAQCCKDACEWCNGRDGASPAKITDDGRCIHLFRGYPPRLCSAFEIIDRSAREGEQRG